MKVIFTAKTNEKFTNGMIYDAKEVEKLKNFSFYDIELLGEYIGGYRSDAFNRDFIIKDQESAVERARYTGIDNSCFTYNKVYEFTREIDSSKKDFMRVLIDKSTLPVDKEFFEKNFIVLHDGEAKSNKEYMVFIEGTKSPNKIHECPVIAETEAVRLVSTPQNIGKTAYIMEVKKKIKSKVVIEVCDGN